MPAPARIYGSTTNRHDAVVSALDDRVRASRWIPETGDGIYERRPATGEPEIALVGSIHLPLAPQVRALGLALKDFRPLALDEGWERVA